MKKIHRIVITGGPCAGKTSAFAKIEEELVKKGYKVFVVPETFSELNNAGIKFEEYPTLDFQRILLDMQIAKEEVYYSAAMMHKNENVVILYNRGVMDPIAYMNKTLARLLIDLSGHRENVLKNRYDAVIHLVTAADGLEEVYVENREKNKTRYETVEEAVNADKALISEWTGHSCLRIIYNNEDFDAKLENVMEEIYKIIS